MQHIRLLPLLLGGASVALLGQPALAQGFNIDFNTAQGTPTSAYGAAAGESGTWNAITPAVPLAPVALTDVSGTATAVTLEVAAGASGYSGLVTWDYDNPNTTGDDGALMDDIFDIGGGFPPPAPSGIVVRVKGLAPNTYDVYSYCFAPDNFLPGNGGFPWITLVDVPGSSDPQAQVGALDWTGAHVEGETYARHTVTVVAGVDLLIVVDCDASGTTAGGFASLNGIQIVENAGSAPAFCTSKPSSLPGCVPTLSAPAGPLTKGAPPGVTATLEPVPGGGNPGIIIYSVVGQTSNPFNTQFGELCIQSFLRASAFAKVAGGTTGVCDGSYGFDLQGIINTYPAIQPGGGLWAQVWYRDPGNPPGLANFSNGIGKIDIQ
jgi:hypothetical protein